MANDFVPLSRLIPTELVPSELFELPEPNPLEQVGVADYHAASLPLGGIYVRADLAIAPYAPNGGEIALGLPQLPDLAVVLRTLGRLEVWVQEELALRVSLGAFAIRLPRALFKPARAANGGWEPDPAREFAEIEIAYETGSGVDREHPIVVTIDRTGRIDVEYPFAETPAGRVLPKVSLDGPAMIGDSGIVIDIEDVAFNFDPDDPTLTFARAMVQLPQDIAGSLVLPAIEIADATLTRRGFSGTVAATWPLVLEGGRFVYQLDGTAQDASLAGLNGGLRQIALALVENRLVALELAGGLLIPYFDEPVDVRVNILGDGDFSVTLLGLDEDGITLRKEELLELSIIALTVARQGDVGAVVVSGGLEPLLMASDGLEWPRLDVTDLAIDTTGKLTIREAWIDLKDLATLDLFGFHFELSRIGLGYEEDRDRLWVNLSGSLRLIEQVPVGLEVEGFRLSWPRNLDQLVTLHTPPTFDDALAVLGLLEVRFDGVYLFYSVPDTVEFEGFIRFIKEAQTVGFAGDVALRVPASGFAAEAGLLVGMSFEPPPFPFLYVYFGVELPAGVPLGQSGLALKGALGLFGLNVAPAKTPEENWYYDWYKRPPLVGAHPTNKWQNERSAVVLGVGVTITTVNGIVKGVRGLLVLALPGPILVIEGRALLLDVLGGGEPPLRALAVFDGREQIVQFNVEARAELVADLLEAQGGVEAFFDFKDLTNWHLYLGQDQPPDRRVLAKIFKLPDGDRYLFDANAYLMLDMPEPGTLRSRAGVFVGFGETFDEYDPLKVTLEASLDGDGVATVRPAQFSAELGLAASLRLAAFGFGLQLAVSADVMAEGPEPFKVQADLTATADLPAPLPDFDAELHFEWTAPPRPEPLPPLIEVGVHGAFVPGGGSAPLQTAARLPGTDADVRGRLDADEGLLPDGEPLHDLAESSPIVPLDARPALVFGQDLNDATDADFARDGDRAYSHVVGQFVFRPALYDVELYERPKHAAWDDPEADWKLLAASRPTGDDVAALWGVWLADAPPAEPSAPGARRLRLWTANPLVHSRGELGAGGQGPFLLDGPRVPFADAFLAAFPDYFTCRDTTEQAVCVGFEDAPDPPKPDGPRTWSYHGLELRASNRLALDRRPTGACLIVVGSLGIRFPATVVEIRLRFCQAPSMPAEAARERVRVSRAAHGRLERDRLAEAAQAAGSEPDPAACAIEVPFTLAVDGATWTIESLEGIDCLALIRPAPLAEVCYLTAAERARAERAAEQCATNGDLLDRLGEELPLLRPDSYYRLVVKTTVHVDQTLSDAAPPIGPALDALYDLALDVLTGEDGDTNGFLQESFFQTAGPPRALGRYVKWSSPEHQAIEVFRDEDLAIRFRRSYIKTMFDHDDYRPWIEIRDAERRLVEGYRTVWSKAGSASLLPEEERWLVHVGDAPPMPADDLLLAERQTLLRELWDDPALAAWERVDVGDRGGVGTTWHVADGELHNRSPLFGGSGRRDDLVAPGTMLVAELPADAAEHLPADFRLTVDLRSERGDPIGVVFRYVDPRNHYRFTLDQRRRLRRLVRLRDGEAELLHETDDGSEPDEWHEIDVRVTSPSSGTARIVVTVDGAVWFGGLDAHALQGTNRVGLYCWRNGRARVGPLAVRAADASVALAPRARYELRALDPRDLLPNAEPPELLRLTFTTSAYPRFRDLVRAGRHLGARTVAAWTAAALESAVSATTAYVAAARAFERQQADYLDERADRAAVETGRTAVRAARAALDEAFLALADAAQLPVFDSRSRDLEVWTLTTDGGGIVGFWPRSAESLDLRFWARGPGQALPSPIDDGEHVGRTELALHHRAAGGPWQTVGFVPIANADSTELLLVPSAAVHPGTAAAWTAGAYRLTLTYHRDHGDEGRAADHRYDRPVRRSAGSTRPDTAYLRWTAGTTG